MSPRLASGWSENGLTSKKMQNADDDLSELIGKRKTNREHSQHGCNMSARFNTNKTLEKDETDQLGVETLSS